MATISTSASGLALSPHQAEERDARFFLRLSLACAAVAILSFMPTYWLQVPVGTFVGTPLIHLHAMLYTAWTLLLVTQCWLVDQRRLAGHRAWGLAGISLATLMVAVGTMTAVRSLAEHIPLYGDRARAFVIVPLFPMLTFALFFGLAIANVRRTDWHRRFIFVATASILGAALARVFFVIFTGGGPGMRPGLVAPLTVTQTMGPVLLSNFVIVAGMVHDWRTRGRPHPAWIIGLGVLVAGEALRIPIAASQGWLHFAGWLTHFA